MQRIAIFASGTGTNAERIMAHFRGHPHIGVSLVLSNKKHAPVLQKAADANVESLTFGRDEFYSGHSVNDALEEKQIDLIVLAGFMWLIPASLIHAYRDRIINIHPALLPKFGGKGMYGMHVHRAVRQAAETETGITIHLVNEEYDKGRILFQARCGIDAEDTPDTIAKKVHRLEYAHFAEQIERFLT